MTNFSNRGFLTLWGQVDHVLLPTRTLGRGRRPSVAPKKDALFMALVVLKHYDTWKKHAADFQMRVPTFEKIINKVCFVLSVDFVLW